MGNRAVIAFSDHKNATGIYVHWNGGIESVLAFSHAARDMGARSPDGDTIYAMAGLVRAVTLFMHSRPGELLSMGVGSIAELDTDNFDNGLFIIGPDWEIKERHFTNRTAKTKSDLDERETAQYQGILACILERHILMCEHDNET